MPYFGMALCTSDCKLGHCKFWRVCPGKLQAHGLVVFSTYATPPFIPSRLVFGRVAQPLIGLLWMDTYSYPCFTCPKMFKHRPEQKSASIRSFMLLVSSCLFTLVERQFSCSCVSSREPGACVEFFWPLWTAHTNWCCTPRCVLIIFERWVPDSDFCQYVSASFRTPMVWCPTVCCRLRNSTGRGFWLMALGHVALRHCDRRVQCCPFEVWMQYNSFMQELLFFVGLMFVKLEGGLLKSVHLLKSYVTYRAAVFHRHCIQTLCIKHFIRIYWGLVGSHKKIKSKAVRVVQL